MPDIYESYLLELSASLSYEIKDPYGAVLSEDMRKKFDSMKRLNYNCMIANQIKGRNIEFSENLISWVKDYLKNKFINRVEKEIRHGKPENVFYNIVYCIISRWKLRCKCDTRSHIISKDKYCELIGKNRKTLSRQCTLIYTDQLLSEIWASEDSQEVKSQTYSGIRSLINEIAETLKEKILSIL